MFHRTVTTMIAAATALAVASPALAQVELNLTGASAEFKFFNEAAPAWLAAPVATHGLGCASTTISAVDTGGHFGITQGYSCAGIGGQDISFRYTSKASFDGILSMKGDSSLADPATVCTTADLTPAQIALEPSPGFYRKMADETLTDFATGVVSGTKCVDVHLGASDVNGQTFVQQSHGQLRGHLGGGFIDRVFNGIDPTGLTIYNPLVVPFGAFVNSAALPGVSNLTRLETVMIYAGFAAHWSDFGPTLPNKRIVACLRHAGSGTHATLDAAVMRRDWPLVTDEVTAASADFFSSIGLEVPVVYFNDSSSDLMRCVNQNGGQATTTHGAVGYADADTCVGKTGAGQKCEFVNPVSYQGEFGLHDNIVNCDYPWWSAQSMYEDPNEPEFATTHPVVLELVAFMSNGSNLATYLPAKAAYWAAQTEMRCSKANDFSYPKFK